LRVILGFTLPYPLFGFFIVIEHTTCKIYLNILDG